MEIKNKLTELFKSDKRIRILIILAFTGILLISMSEMIPHTSVTRPQKDVKSSYVDTLQKQTESLISSINGVGKCKVMITIKSTNETVYAQNSEISENNGNYSSKYEYVFYDGNNGDEPVLIKEYMPQVQGVAVVCEGGDNAMVRECIISAISSLFNISSSKISISKLG